MIEVGRLISPPPQVPKCGDLDRRFQAVESGATTKAVAFLNRRNENHRAKLCHDAQNSSPAAGGLGLLDAPSVGGGAGCDERRSI
jgi:hypothetical protein